MRYKIDTVYTLRSPLSHIGESESTQTFLNTITVRNGSKVEEVFAYSGNAIRGAWRDAGAKYLLDKLGNLKVPKKTFHLLFTGGSISGDQSLDVEQAKNMRAALPFLSIFGGGIGNQILSGKITQTFAYPVCHETRFIIPPDNPYIDYDAQSISWRKLTQEISFSRKDDAKDTLGETYIATDVTMLDTSEKPSKSSEAATQMRYTAEYLVPNTQLWHSLIIDCNEVELGALVASIYEWGKSPYLGGMSAKGFGYVDMDMIISSETSEPEPFITISQNNLMLREPAENAKEKYDAELFNLYNQYLEGNQKSLIEMLEG